MPGPKAASGEPAPQQSPQSTPPPRSFAQYLEPGEPSRPAPAASQTAVPVVDVVSKLEHLASVNSEKLNWKVSIVDLLKLLDIDSSFTARKDLAVELGCPAEMMNDSAQMNTWLHKTVLQKLAENGGNIPKELLD